MTHAIFPGYQKIIDQAKSNRKENKDFITRLQKLKPKDLDSITHQFHDEAFENIDCLKCGNCCATTGPLLKTKDVDILAAQLKMRPAGFMDQYVRTDEDGDLVFKEMPCPFLGKNNYCSVYESRPGACRDYPHTQQRDIRAKLPITFLNSMICPAVAVVVDKLKNHYSTIGR